jgi:hypothetical protein
VVENPGVIFIALLVFLAGSSCLLWLALNLGGPLEEGEGGRLTAAFFGVWAATAIGVFGLALQGINETATRHSWAAELGLALVASAAEGCWILVMCGSSRRVLAPSLAALGSVAILIWFASGV